MIATVLCKTENYGVKEGRKEGRNEGVKEGRKMVKKKREEGRIEELDETVMYPLWVLSAILFVLGTSFSYVLRTFYCSPA